MGMWTSCRCGGKCSPPGQLREILSSTVSAVPEVWRFEAWTSHWFEYSRMVKMKGSWAVGAFLKTNKPTLMKLVLFCKGGDEYFLRVYAEHNSCPFDIDDDSHSEYLWGMVDEFREHRHNVSKGTHWNNGGVGLDGVFGPKLVRVGGPKDAKTWRIMESAIRTKDFEEATEWLLEAIDSVEEYGWF